MKEIRLHEGELNIMELLWSNDSLAAKDIAKIIKEYVGWEKNTTYTVIKRLIDKGAVIRQDPGFLCIAAVTKKSVQITEADNLIHKFFNDSLYSFIVEYLKTRTLSEKEMAVLEEMVLKYNIVNKSK